ncbi:MAG: hypothetical protein HN729_00365 [Candidatus Marinimicrobia bacterium]|nr:hypothetical protein [Candidatus Neomarinimicrobiota bacterium]MBT3633475.1 hypothetical protein [Candidatus Neomarinimicrobiota bacterium]MBT3681617.1 hypothetical protein [Candidatus Neomarinimicrobiota bacterium]MBT3758415.1 hypothetical protein [Candidatus Neomarinimicrobiota bacterium]MBT3894931.1 hypothetical protein [Candidatus Neomarinimicrobiota bacterium]
MNNNIHEAPNSNIFKLFFLFKNKNKQNAATRKIYDFIAESAIVDRIDWWKGKIILPVLIIIAFIKRNTEPGMLEKSICANSPTSKLRYTNQARVMVIQIATGNQ